MSSRIRIDLTPAFILHTWPYRETSLLVDALTQQHGRIRGLIRGARRPSSPFRGVSRPFFPLLMAWSGRSGHLVNFSAIEPVGAGYWLRGKAFMSAFYLNELLLRLLQLNDPVPKVYGLYVNTLAALNVADDESVESVLRCFEFDFLAALGFGLMLDKTTQQQQAIEAERCYVVGLERGVEIAPGQGAYGHSQAVWSGKSLLAIKRRDFSCKETQQAAKRLARHLLQALLGDKPLKTRACYAVSALSS